MVPCNWIILHAAVLWLTCYRKRRSWGSVSRSIQFKCIHYLASKIGPFMLMCATVCGIEQFILEYTIDSKINGTPQRCLLANLGAIHSILAIANLLALNNITISYYGQVNSLWVKSNVASKWASKHLWECHLICFWWYKEMEILF